MRRKTATAGVARWFAGAVRLAASARLLVLLLVFLPALLFPALRLPVLISPAHGFSSETEHRVNELRRSARLDRFDVKARKGLAEILGESDDVELRREAAEALSEALLTDESDVDLWIRFARLQTKRGFQREARLAYNRALELAPKDPDLWSELAAHELRRFQHYHRDGLFEKALSHNNRSLDLAPDVPATIARAARLAALTGDRAGLDSLCGRWMDTDPDNAWPHLLRGALLTEVGAWGRARDEFADGMSRLPEEARRSFVELSAVDPLAEELRQAAPDTARFWQDFWRWRDPTPADGDNPRLLEHYRRLVQAELYFGKENLDLFGWRHAPGRAVISYGLPEDWVYLRDVFRGSDYKVSSFFAVPALNVRFGQGAQPFFFTFVDYTLNGHFYHPITGGPTGPDFLMAETPSHYVPPFKMPELEQEIELWRFWNPDGGGRIEVVVALSPELWPKGLIADPSRLASQMTLYDEAWETRDAAVASWAQLETDHLGRLVGVFRLDAVSDSAIVGIETRDRLGAGRAAGYATLAPAPNPGTPTLSDIAFLTRVGFDGSGGRYGRAYGSALPNLGHLYQPGQPLGLAFEAYGLAVETDGRHRARVSVTVGRQTPGGWLRVLLPVGGNTPEAEMVFEVSEAGSTVEQLLSIDLPRLRSGEYTLRVEVEDLAGGGSARAEAPFTVLKRGRTP